MIEVSEDKIDTTRKLARFSQLADNAGAVVSFEGKVRNTSQKGNVRSLFLQSYEPITTNGIKDAVAEVEARWPVTAITAIHRVGIINLGETIVFVAAASKHRRDAFNAVDMLMDYLKTRAIFWKKEITAYSETWIEPRQEDYSDSSRWYTNKD